MHRSVQNRYAVLAFGTFTFTCVGIIYGWSKFSAAIRADLALNHAQITLAYTISIAMFSLGIALDGLLSRLCSVKTSVTAACLMTGGGFLVSSFLTAGGRFALYAVYGLLVGLGMGIIYGGWLSDIMVWFPGGRGLTTGVLLTAIGFSGLTITPVFASLASAHGWRISFRLIGVLFFVIAALSPLFLAPSARRPAENAAPSAPASGYSTAEVLRQREFWFFCIWKLLLVSVGQAFLGQLAPIIADIRGSDALQLLCVSLAVFINGISRTLWGWFSDVWGYRRALLSIGMVGVVSTAGLWYFLRTESLPMTFFFLLLYFVTFGGAASIGPSFIRTYYGAKDFRTNNGISALTVVPGNMIVTASIGFIRTSAGSYLPFFAYALPATVLATLMCLAVFTPRFRSYRS